MQVKTKEGDDRLLIDRCRKGDWESFDTLMHRYGPFAHAVAARYTGDRDMAEDVVSDAMLKAYVNLPKFRADSRFATWFYRIVANSAKDRTGRSAAQPLSLEAILSLDPGAECEMRSAFAAPIEEGSLEVTSQMREDVRDALGHSLPEHRELLNLFHGLRCSYATIASVLGVPVGTVRSRLHRARLSLRRHIEATRAVDVL